MPMVLGHEAVGTVIRTGSAAAADFAEGDRVVLSFLPQCGRCKPCVSGEPFLCERGTAANGAGTLLCGDKRLSEHDHPIHHHLGASAFASHAVVDRRSAVKIPQDIPVEIAALFGCAVLTGVGAVLNTAGLRAGESVVIYGLGGVGLAALLGAVAGGGVPIVVVDPIAEKRALALELGAAAALHPGDGADAIIAAMDGRPDVVIETVGKAVVLEQAYGLARRGGRIVTVGLPNPAERMSLSPVQLVGEGKSLIGSYMGSSIPARDIPRYIALWRAGRLPVERLLSSVSPIGDINRLFRTLESGEAIRQIVIP
jgi:alcohol dehydrogenase